MIDAAVMTLILITMLVAMRARSRPAVIVLWVLSLIAAAALLRYHIDDPIPLNF